MDKIFEETIEKEYCFASVKRLLNNTISTVKIKNRNN